MEFPNSKILIYICFSLGVRISYFKSNKFLNQALCWVNRIKTSPCWLAWCNISDVVGVGGCDQLAIEVNEWRYFVVVLKSGGGIIHKDYSHHYMVVLQFRCYTYRFTHIYTDMKRWVCDHNYTYTQTLSHMWIYYRLY